MYTTKLIYEPADEYETDAPSEIFLTQHFTTVIRIVNK